MHRIKPMPRSLLMSYVNLTDPQPTFFRPKYLHAVQLLEKEQCSSTPYDGSIVMCHLSGQIVIWRLRLIPFPRLEDFDFIEKIDTYDLDDDNPHAIVKGVITQIINDARTGEFDDFLPCNVRSGGCE